MSNYTKGEKEEIANKIKNICVLVVSIPDDLLEEVIREIDDTEAGSILYMALGKQINFDKLFATRERIEALQKLKEVFVKTNKAFLGDKLD